MSTSCISRTTSGTGALYRRSADGINPTTNAATVWPVWPVWPVRPGWPSCAGNSDRRHAKQQLRGWMYRELLLQCGPARGLGNQVQLTRDLDLDSEMDWDLDFLLNSKTCTRIDDAEKRAGGEGCEVKKYSSHPRSRRHLTRISA